MAFMLLRVKEAMAEPRYADSSVLGDLARQLQQRGGDGGGDGGHGHDHDPVSLVLFDQRSWVLC